MKPTRLIFTLALSSILGCNDSNTTQEITCSTIFKSIDIEVQDTTGKPYIFDDHYTLQLSDRDTIREPMNSEGYYTVLNDRQHEELKEKQDSFLFVGIKDSAVVVQEMFVINGDQCHINKVSGEDKVVVK